VMQWWGTSDFVFDQGSSNCLEPPDRHSGLLPSRPPKMKIEFPTVATPNSDRSDRAPALAMSPIAILETAERPTVKKSMKRYATMTLC
jgi:hypothetical protein